MDMGILCSCNDDALQPYLCEEGHPLSSTYGGGDSADVSIKCKACEKSLNNIAKVTQKKTGFMRCAECTSDVNYCNGCRPRPQVRSKSGVEVSSHTLGVFRVARSEAIFVKAIDLLAMTDRILAMLLTSNIIITEENDDAKLIDIIANLAERITEDNKWADAAKCRFILVSAASFTASQTFLQGGKLAAPAADKPTDRGGLITQICRKVTIAKKRLQNADTMHAFVTRFLKDKDAKYEDSKDILTEMVAQEYPEAKERQTEEARMEAELKALWEPSSSLEATESTRNVGPSLPTPSADKTPDFMKKFTEESKKLIQEGGKEFFQPVKFVRSSAEFQGRFDEVVFESDSRSPGQHQRK